MIATCPKCHHEMTTFCDPRRNKSLTCRWCGKSTVVKWWKFTEERTIISRTQDSFVRASDLPQSPRR